MQRDRVNLMQRQILGSVRLEPSFSFYGESLKVTFRIGNRRLYVLKNLGDFVNAVAGSEWASYGKELAFYHHPEAFAPEYRPLVNFLTFTLLKGSSYMGNYLSSVYKKELVVSAELVDGFLESVRTIPLREEGTGREWSMEDGEPERLLEIASEGSGALVRLKKIPMLTGRQGIYFFDTGRIFRMDRERGGDPGISSVYGPLWEERAVYRRIRASRFCAGYAAGAFRSFSGENEGLRSGEMASAAGGIFTLSGRAPAGSSHLFPVFGLWGGTV